MSAEGVATLLEAMEVGATFEAGTQGACYDADGETQGWFFGEGGKGGAGQVAAAKAKALCAVCPVQQECLDFALDTGQRFGIWGGLTARQRVGQYRDENLKYASFGNSHARAQG